AGLQRPFRPNGPSAGAGPWHHKNGKTEHPYSTPYADPLGIVARLPEVSDRPPAGKSRGHTPSSSNSSSGKEYCPLRARPGHRDGGAPASRARAATFSRRADSSLGHRLLFPLVSPRDFFGLNETVQRGMKRCGNARALGFAGNRAAEKIHFRLELVADVVEHRWRMIGLRADLVHLPRVFVKLHA